VGKIINVKPKQAMGRYDIVKGEKKEFSKDQLRRINDLEKEISLIKELNSINPNKTRLYTEIIEDLEKGIKQIKLEGYGHLYNNGTIVYPDPDTGIYDLTETNINGEPSQEIIRKYFLSRQSRSYNKRIVLSDLIDIRSQKEYKKF
jgi:hypothetical protein